MVTSGSHRGANLLWARRSGSRGNSASVCEDVFKVLPKQRQRWFHLYLSGRKVNMMCECRSVCRSRLLWCFLSKWIKIHHKKWVKLSSNKEKRNVCRSVWRFLRDLCVVVFYSAACVADFAQFRVLSIKETWNSVKHNESLVQPCAVRTCWNSQNNHDASVVNKSEVFDASGDKLTLYTQNTHTRRHTHTHLSG